MGMYETIKNFHTQFAFEPVIKNFDALKGHEWVIAAGMGGSHLAAGLLKVWKPELPLIIHKNYGLPDFPEHVLGTSLLIANSYSGNTEETLDAYLVAGKKGMARAAVSTGGKLLEFSEKDGTPYIKMPDTNIQPRSALGFSFKSFLRLLGEEETLQEVGKLSESLNAARYEESGKMLAERLKGFVPVVYSSEKNWPIAYNWKIKFNETGKIPAFYNIFPELNHNEMTGFDAKENTRVLSEKFYFIFITDAADHSKIQQRMIVTMNLFKDRGLPVEEVPLSGDNIFYKIFSSMLIADWTSYYTAENYGVEAEKVPMVEEFKKLVA